MSVLANLIDEHKQRAAAEDAAKAARVVARYQETRHMAEGAIAATLGAEVWEELAALAGRPQAKRDAAGAVTELAYPVEHPDLVPFTLAATAHFTRGNGGETGQRLAGYQIAAQQGLHPPAVLANAQDLGAFLAGLAAVRAERDEDERRRRVQALSRALDNPRVDPAAAEAARDELLALSEEEDARRRYGQWQTMYEARLAREAEERENRCRLGDYAAALRAWDLDGQAARAAQTEKLRALQARFDVPFNAFRLAYGVVAEEDGARYAETALATVLEAEPGEGGWYTRLDNHALVPFRPAHPVSLTRMISLPRLEGVRVRDEATGLALFAAPDRVAEARVALAELAAALPALPAEPDPAGFGLARGAHYDSGGWHAWETVENVREMVLACESLPPWRDRS